MSVGAACAKGYGLVSLVKEDEPSQFATSDLQDRPRAFTRLLQQYTPQREALVEPCFLGDPQICLCVAFCSSQQEHEGLRA